MEKNWGRRRCRDWNMKKILIIMTFFVSFLWNWKISEKHNRLPSTEHNKRMRLSQKIIFLDPLECCTWALTYESIQPLKAFFFPSLFSTILLLTPKWMMGIREKWTSINCVRIFNLNLAAIGLRREVVICSLLLWRWSSTWSIIIFTISKRRAQGAVSMRCSLIYDITSLFYFSCVKSRTSHNSERGL